MKHSRELKKRVTREGLYEPSQYYNRLALQRIYECGKLEFIRCDRFKLQAEISQR